MRFFIKETRLTFQLKAAVVQQLLRVTGKSEFNLAGLKAYRQGGGWYAVFGSSKAEGRDVRKFLSRLFFWIEKLESKDECLVYWGTVIPKPARRRLVVRGCGRNAVVKDRSMQASVGFFYEIFPDMSSLRGSSMTHV